MPTLERKQIEAQEALEKAGPDFIANKEFQEKFLGLVQNEFYSRASFIRKWLDPRRDYNKECGYPETGELTSDKYQELYDRNPVAARVVELMPNECWQIVPNVVEDDDPNVTTPFEQAVQDLAKTLRSPVGQSYYRPDDKETHPLWEYCKRIDILSGIGQYGVMLLGFNDGLSLNQPVRGWQEGDAPNITWNEEALPFINSNLTHGVVKLGPNNELVWNLTEEERQQVNAKNNGKKKKGKLPPEPLDAFQGKSMPSAQAFGNRKAQQSTYRDPMDTEGSKNIVPYNDPTAESHKLVTKETRTDPNSLQPFRENTKLTDGQPEQEEQSQLQLIYIRVFPESLVQISQYEQNMASPRYGQPVMYRITLHDPAQQFEGFGIPLSTVEVHYSRVIHIADNLQSSEIFGVPRQRPVLNNLIDLQKIAGASGEGYWKNAFATLAAETHPQLGADVTVDKADLRNQMKKWRDSLDRVLAATGITWRTLSPQVIDPGGFIQNELQLISIKLGVPLRVFMGSEQGVLAASQDARAWYSRVQERRKNYLTPRMIVPILDRLIQVGVLPEPANGYGVSWNEEQKLMPTEQAQIAGALTQSLATYISGQVDQFIDPVSYLVEVWGWDRKRATDIVEATIERLTKQQEIQGAQPDQYIDPRTGQPVETDEMGQPMDPQTGQPVQTDEFGQPVVQDPQTGEVVRLQKQQASESQGPLGAEVAERQLAQQPEQLPPEEQGRQLEQGQPTEQPVSPQQAERPDVQGLLDRIRGEQPPEEEPQPQGEQLPEGPLQRDSETGRLIDPETGWSIDTETGDIYDENGQPLGNIEDVEAQDQEQ